jgi:dihydrofolate synthase/folylpolyglutamate synthase
MYQKQGPTALKPKLTNTIAFCEHLKNPHARFKSIHVAGTNGKGSSSHMLASVLQEAGYQVGLYTSPHLVDFRERIKINGTPIPEQTVVSFIKQHQEYLITQQLSFFEMTVGMAFWYFEQQQVDIAVIEVGLGGRFDSTNIITPEVALITNIGLDHTDILGDTIELIAAEKAGIIKPNIPVVISEYNPLSFPVFESVAQQKNAPLTLAANLEVSHESDLLGSYQLKNIKGVVATLAQLKEFNINETHLKVGLLNTVKNTQLLGRWQKIGTKPTILCDTAHNKEGLAIVVSQVQQETYEVLHIVLGFVKDKKLENILPLFPKNAIYYFCAPNLSRGLSAKVLKERAAEFELEGSVYDSVSEALAAAREKAAENDFIYVGGSTFVVAEVL